MSLATLGGIAFQVDPYSVEWDVSMKVVKKRTVGGYVAQILGINLGDMKVTGKFAYGSTPGDSYAWEEQERFRQQIIKWSDNAEHNINNTIRFEYPSRGWSFEVYVKDFNSSQGISVVHSNEIIAPDWELTLFIVQDRTKTVISGIEDIYLKRLFNGVGWRQTSFNGPITSDEAAAYMQANGGADFTAYARAQYVKASGSAGAAADPAAAPAAGAPTTANPGTGTDPNGGASVPPVAGGTAGGPKDGAGPTYGDGWIKERRSPAAGNLISFVLGGIYINNPNNASEKARLVFQLRGDDLQVYRSKRTPKEQADFLVTLINTGDIYFRKQLP